MNCMCTCTHGRREIETKTKGGVVVHLHEVRVVGAATTYHAWALLVDIITGSFILYQGMSVSSTIIIKSFIIIVLASRMASRAYIYMLESGSHACMIVSGLMTSSTCTRPLFSHLTLISTAAVSNPTLILAL